MIKANKTLFGIFIISSLISSFIVVGVQEVVASKDDEKIDIDEGDRIQYQIGANTIIRFRFEEKTKIDENIKSYLRKSLLAARIDPNMLSTAVKRLGWKKTLNLLVRPSQPTKPKKRRGDFGEILTSAILVELMGYTIPVQKLRFTIKPEQSLPGTDIIAIKKGNGYFSEMCFVESKLRTSNDRFSCRAAIEGYEQLRRDYLDRVPDMIQFILARLHERGDPLFYEFLNYLNNRQDLTHIDRFRLGLTWEHGKWKEEVLELLEKDVEEKNLPRTVVQRVLVQELKTNIKDLFESIGVDMIENE